MRSGSVFLSKPFLAYTGDGGGATGLAALSCCEEFIVGWQLLNFINSLMKQFELWLSVRVRVCVFPDFNKALLLTSLM